MGERVVQYIFIAFNVLAILVEPIIWLNFLGVKAKEKVWRQLTKWIQYSIFQNKSSFSYNSILKEISHLEVHIWTLRDSVHSNSSANALMDFIRTPQGTKPKCSPLKAVWRGRERERGRGNEGVEEGIIWRIYRACIFILLDPGIIKFSKPPTYPFPYIPYFN